MLRSSFHNDEAIKVLVVFPQQTSSKNFSIALSLGMKLDLAML